MFKCIECEETYRKGMEYEKYFFLGGPPEIQGTAKCVYCYNKKSKNPVEIWWFTSVADRLEHEDKVKEFVNLYAEDFYIDIDHYETDNKYQLNVCIKKKFPLTEGDIIRFREKLIQDGMKCGEINFSNYYGNYAFTVDFKDNERVFTR